jgi:hypothetical protein
MAVVRTTFEKHQNGKGPPQKCKTGVYLVCSAYSCESLQPQISRKSAEIPPTFQRAFLNRECASSNPPAPANQFGPRRNYPL